MVEQGQIFEIVSRTLDRADLYEADFTSDSCLYRPTEGFYPQFDERLTEEKYETTQHDDAMPGWAWGSDYFFFGKARKVKQVGSMPAQTHITSTDPHGDAEYLVKYLGSHLVNASSAETEALATAHSGSEP